MDTMYRRRTQLSAVAVAALAIVAVAAVMLLAGGAPAQADTVATTPGGSDSLLPQPQSKTPTPTPPRHAPPPACPKDAAAVVDSGHIALFDVWWNDDELELTNTSCPPTIKYVPAQEAVPGGRGNPGKPATPARTDRAASSIDINTTIIHIPNSAKVDLNAANTPYPEGEYEDLWKADALEDRDTDGDKVPEEGVGDRIVWALPACPPDGTAATGDLCIAFSAALLNPADWKAGSKIEYLLDHVHQVDIDKQDPRYTLAYDKDENLLWDSSDVQIVEMKVTPGGYERPVLFFTSRGTYELQVHIRGEPNRKKDRADGLKPVSMDDSVSSDMREYIIHVGAEADLSVAAIAGQKNVSPSEEADFAITARNNGPETVPSATVDVTIPPGLTYKSHDNPVSFPFVDSDGDGVWTWDAGSLTSGASKTLVVRTTADAETHGQTMTVKATIAGTEPVKITETNDKGKREEVEYDLPVADEEPGNNADTASVKIDATDNAAPMFRVTRSVAENSAAGTPVGDPVDVSDSGDTLTFILTGEGADQFAASQVSGGAQIAVAEGADLDFEFEPTYNLVMGVSDGKDANGNADPSVDHTIAVRVELEDVAGDPTLTLSASATSLKKGQNVTLTATANNLPEGHGHVSYRWIQIDPRDGRIITPYTRSASTWTFTQEGGRDKPITYHFRVEATWTKDGVETRLRSSNQVTVTWSN